MLHPKMILQSGSAGPFIRRVAMIPLSLLIARHGSTLKKLEVMGRVPMESIHDTFRAFCEDESGQDLIEYALVAGLISLGAITAMSGLATKIGSAFNSVGSQLASAL